VFKRLFWLVTGAGFGFGSSFWLMRHLRQRVERYRPTRVAARLGADLQVALVEGRTAMREREAELRAAQARRTELRAASHPRPHSARRQLTAAR
jgi:hypothetical protein